MYQYRVWIRLNQLQTANVLVYADNDYSAKQLGEAQYGAGSVLAYTKVN